MSVDYEESFIKNSRGVSLLTCKWGPRTEVKGLVFLCHGYMFNCSSYMRGCGSRLAKAGFAVYGIDLEGHGRSHGPRGYVKKMDFLVDDCEYHFKSICRKSPYKEKGRFLYGECSGGTIVLMIHKRDPTFWTGAVLIAPLCKVADGLRISKSKMSLLAKAEYFLPKWKIFPSRDLIEMGIKDATKREELKQNKFIYHGKPTLKTASEMMRAAILLQEMLEEVILPFIILHGGQDRVVAPEGSQELYNRARSIDKTLKVYPDMWHALEQGEPQENVDLVFDDIISWLDQRALAAAEGRGPLLPPSPPASPPGEDAIDCRDTIHAPQPQVCERDLPKTKNHLLECDEDDPYSSLIQASSCHFGFRFQ